MLRGSSFYLSSAQPPDISSLHYCIWDFPPKSICVPRWTICWGFPNLLRSSLGCLVSKTSHPRNQLPWLITTWSICGPRWMVLYLRLSILVISRPGWSQLSTSAYPSGSICVTRWTILLLPSWNQIDLLPWRRYLQASMLCGVTSLPPPLRPVGWEVEADVYWREPTRCVQ